MADPKVAGAKPAGDTGHDIMHDFWIFLAILILVVIGTYVTKVDLNTLTNGSVIINTWNFIVQWWVGLDFSADLSVGVKNFLYSLIVFFIGSSFWLYLKGVELHHIDDHKYTPIDPRALEHQAQNTQWQIVLNHMNSENPAEWKLAILEADNMLDDILDQNGYVGDSLGEKLKSINPGSLQSYDDAWEAHKIRNQVAHEGSNMDFTRRTAQVAISKFENVFRELKVI